MGYAQDNAGFLTASKLKELLKCPEIFEKKYDLFQIPEESTSSLTLGTMVDDFVSYGKEEFFKKYAFEEKLLKGPLQAKLDEMGIIYDSKAVVSELKVLYYGERTLISPAIAEKLGKIFKEIERQPFFDLQNKEYKAQHQFDAVYKGVKLRGTTDRVNFEKSIDGKNILRDTKTCKDERYHKAIKDYDYIFSMSYYDLLMELETGEKPDEVILDFITTGSEPKYIPVIIPREILEEERHRVIYALDKYLEYQKAGKFPSCTKISEPDNMFPSYLKCSNPTFCSGCVPTEPVIFQPFM